VIQVNSRCGFAIEDSTVIILQLALLLLLLLLLLLPPPDLRNVVDCSRLPAIGRDASGCIGLGFFIRHTVADETWTDCGMLTELRGIDAEEIRKHYGCK